jgi:hypothetical protein
MKQTKNCVRCLKPAKMWTGHVRDLETKEEIIAGWCSQRCYKVAGFKGIYIEEMEVEEDR